MSKQVNNASNSNISNVSKFTSTARPYAKALFEHALMHDTVADWGNVLKQWSMVFEYLNQVNAETNNMISIAWDAHWVDVLLDVITHNAFNVKKVLLPYARNFLEILLGNCRLDCLPSVQVVFETYQNIQNHQHNVQFESAHALSEDEIQIITNKVSQYFEGDLNVSCSINSEMMGGLKIKHEDTVIDASIQNRLQKLKAALLK